MDASLYTSRHPIPPIHGREYSKAYTQFANRGQPMDYLIWLLPQPHMQTSTAPPQNGIGYKHMSGYQCRDIDPIITNTAEEPAISDLCF